MPRSSSNKSTKNKSTKSKSKSKKLTIAEQYQKMEQQEHVLELPDTYIGSVDINTNDVWIYDNKKEKLIYKKIDYIPGLYKIFDEIIVNARDHSVNDKTCKNIKVEINGETGYISCRNDGENGIPVVIHPEHNIYIPEMIFGVLLTSSNYKQKGKTVGGKNGIGAKACNIYSDEFYIEIYDKKRKKLYKQTFSKNMYEKTEPNIEDVSKSKSYTLIKFKPDYKRFGVDGLSDDTLALFNKRVYDIAATTRDNLNVYLNGKKLSIKKFEDYIKMYYNNEDDDENAIEKRCIFEEVNDRWSVGVVYDPSPGYRQISYVNGIYTINGGSHVNHVVNQIVSGLTGLITSKHKDIKIKPAHIKDNITVFVNSIIEDPSFNSQSKEELKSLVSTFGSRCDINDDFIKKLSKTGIINVVMEIAKLKTLASMKKTDGKKKPNVRGIGKLDDAHWAGTRKSSECRLFLTEGDSAKSFAISGMDIIGKEKYGVFPLKGKLLNVREATQKQLINNEEIKNIKNILGLQQGKKYKDTKSLRYGGIIILTDSDVDGSHIKGLIMNLFHYFWPSLLKIKGFIQSMVTPIVKAYKISDKKMLKPKIFYTLTDYENWAKSLGGSLKSKGWTSKYYKGLGTSDDKEAKESFIDFEKKVISYIWSSNDDDNNNNKDNKDNQENQDSEKSNGSKKTNSDSETEDFCEDKHNPNNNAITLGFAKNRISDRKSWLKSYDRNIILESKEKNISFHDFIHKDLIHFSNYDCVRSIPSIMDGLKPGQRKILYVCFKKKLKNPVKVSQLSGAVLELAAYHHGENSLHQTIIAMAQQFVGSNNINLLFPAGNFGYRREGGKEAASARYISTRLEDLTTMLFRSEDDTIYNYLDDDGQSIEPEFYCPIIPMVLINGISGIGTGFSTDIPSFNPLDVIQNMKNIIDKKEIKKIKPWYRGFKGKIYKNKQNSYTTEGIYEIIDENNIKITELPIGTWISKYYTWLETLIVDKKDAKKGQIIENIINNSTNNIIDFTVKLIPGKLQELIKNNEIVKKFKLTSKVHTSNMHLYNPNGTIQKYYTVDDIFNEYYQCRYKFYVKRKKYYQELIEHKLDLLKYKIKFLKYIETGKIIIIKNKKGVSTTIIEGKLKEYKFPEMSISIDAKKSYDYLTNISIKYITPEHRKDLEDEYQKIFDELELYKNTSIEDIWLSEIDHFEKLYRKWLDELEVNEGSKKKKRTRRTRKTKKK